MRGNDIKYSSHSAISKYEVEKGQDMERRRKCIVVLRP